MEDNVNIFGKLQAVIYSNYTIIAFLIKILIVKTGTMCCVNIELKQK